MKMIIGGAFQGKTEYAKNINPDKTWIDCKMIPFDEFQKSDEIFTYLSKKEGILHLEALIRYFVEQRLDYSKVAEILIEKNPNVILTVQEVGYGVVPMDAIDREYREAVGRIATKLAAFSNQVIRVCCGIGSVIKDCN